MSYKERLYLGKSLYTISYSEDIKKNWFESRCLLYFLYFRINGDYNTIICQSDYEGMELKGKFSSGIEGALASTLNRDFNWKQLLKTILCIYV